MGWLGRVMGWVLGFQVERWVVGLGFPSHFLVWGCFFLLFCWVVLLFSPPLGSGAFLPAPFRPVFFVIFWEPAPPKGGGRQHDQKEEEAKQPLPQGRGRKQHY